MILRTTNAGVNWYQMPSGTTNDLYETHFTMPTVGYAVGENGTIIYTTNGGNNWVQLVSNTNNTLRSVFFPVSNTGYAVGLNGTIRKTTTGFVVGIEPVNSLVPDKFSLHQNYPNPFNPVTKIGFDIPLWANVRLSVFDVSGKEVASLLNQYIQPGSYEIGWDGSNYASGIYYYKVITESFTETKKMILVK